jgi:predicted transcriptional regulator
MMGSHRWQDIKRRKLSPEQIERIEREVEEEILEMNLRAVRELLGRTQVDVAKAADMDQSEVSKAERRKDHLLSTLRRYVEALGGEIEVIASFGDKRIRLQGV